MTDALKLLDPKEKVNDYPDTLPKVVTDLSQVDSLKENIGHFEEQFRAVLEKIQKLKRAYRKSRRINIAMKAKYKKLEGVCSKMESTLKKKARALEHCGLLLMRRRLCRM